MSGPTLQKTEDKSFHGLALPRCFLVNFVLSVLQAPTYFLNGLLLTVFQCDAV